MFALGRFLPFVTVPDFLVFATCYAASPTEIGQSGQSTDPSGRHYFRKMAHMFRFLVLAAMSYLWVTPTCAQEAGGNKNADSISPLPRGVVQPAERFARAVQELSTSPHYVRIQINAGPGDPGSVSCLPGEDLNVAIRREYNLPSNPEGIARAARIAIASPDRTFTFSNASALQIVMPTFSEADLIRVRSTLASYSNDELRAGFSLSPWGRLHAYFRNRKDRDAAACVLIERNLSPGIADLTASIYIDGQ